MSGGMDSCVAAGITREQGFELAFLHINYGQRTQDRELKAFLNIADFYSVGHRFVSDIKHLSQIGGSSLTDPNREIPAGDLFRNGIPDSYVPFRNANLLTIATSWAEVLNASAICIGAVEEDSSGYPDCREGFFKAFETVIREGTRPQTNIRILTPLIQMTKREIVQAGLRIGAPLALTWSCYQNSDLACGKCDSCLLRLRGFKQAGVNDPIPYLFQNDSGL
jgi:7-cyano-7-deazaguanine synthase